MENINQIKKINIRDYLLYFVARNSSNKILISCMKEGVREVIIMDGRIPHSILMELLTNEGAGTMVLGD